MPDFELHLGSDDLFDLFGDESDLTSSGHGFGEDPDEIDRIIEEEMGKPRRRKKPRKN